MDKFLTRREKYMYERTLAEVSHKGDQDRLNAELVILQKILLLSRQDEEKSREGETAHLPYESIAQLKKQLRSKRKKSMTRQKLLNELSGPEALNSKMRSLGVTPVSASQQSLKGMQSGYDFDTME